MKGSLHAEQLLAHHDPELQTRQGFWLTACRQRYACGQHTGAGGDAVVEWHCLFVVDVGWVCEIGALEEKQQLQKDTSYADHQ